MAKKTEKSSSVRKFSLYRDIPISTISLVQSYEKNKNAEGIRQALNKPNLSDPTALGYGRLANQYITMLNKPNRFHKSHIRTQFNIVLTDNYRQNLRLSGNEKPIVGPPPIVSYSELIRMHGTLGTYANGNIYTEIIKPDIAQFFQDLTALNNYVGLLRKNGITHYRVYVEFNTKSGNHVFISTSILSIPNYQIIEAFITNAEQMSETNILYDYEDNTETLTDIISIIVEYM